MKKVTVLLAILMLAILASTVMAQPVVNPWRAMPDAMLGSVLLFQKCDEINGCPTGPDPWPILPTGRWGQLSYNFLGPVFKYNFFGTKLAPKTVYTLIYYPDPWPGNGLCLGTRKSDFRGNLQIGGHQVIPSGLPFPTDDNYNIGAKIWLVLEDDVTCDGTTATMTGWNPASYLFEGNVIRYQYTGPPVP